MPYCYMTLDRLGWYISISDTNVHFYKTRFPVTHSHTHATTTPPLSSGASLLHRRQGVKSVS